MSTRLLKLPVSSPLGMYFDQANIECLALLHLNRRLGAGGWGELSRSVLYEHPSIINVTLGMRTPEQVGQNVELHDQHVPDGLWDDLRTQGLVRPDVLTGHGGGRGERCL
ncbi:hypothetical protein GCM10010255_79280 [Streptomyces coeruleofuscus]|uniref:Uncharacterized protein n=1 Tax=Streptomyces coeruleofuscus TaxID=66879 RepID=A0ABN3JA40_9ACTN